MEGLLDQGVGDRRCHGAVPELQSAQGCQLHVSFRPRVRGAVRVDRGLKLVVPAPRHSQPSACVQSRVRAGGAPTRVVWPQHVQPDPASSARRSQQRPAPPGCDGLPCHVGCRSVHAPQRSHRRTRIHRSPRLDEKAQLEPKPIHCTIDDLSILTIVTLVASNIALCMCQYTMNQHYQFGRWG
ncbi:hypothetical protein H257_09716 [Aphanomyces astaci]|uniref:Uncharacterized protein n=1 Tax=Aphanomyces astaci TaxID=112090 RepID=W4GB86_APHAT|nr:hypothetical protein H257_09716 [Aphanomyces astaci]ETV76208.1 hypothetical protein H257_09716 [Aphanomyces astaci]|eukprot:XP_009834333.1 hypothetical protein H257_09716 [Aphanomyces astaci]